MLYLNLDLLENVNEYLYPLFYYSTFYTDCLVCNCDPGCISCESIYTFEVYSPVTLKSILCCDGNEQYYDYKNEIKIEGNNLNDDIISKLHKFTKEFSFYDKRIHSTRTDPFELPKGYLYFLKSKKKFNLNDINLI